MKFSLIIYIKSIWTALVCALFFCSLSYAFGWIVHTRNGGSSGSPLTLAYSIKFVLTFCISAGFCLEYYSKEHV